MKLKKHIKVLYLSIVSTLLLLSFGCQRSPVTPDDDLIQHLQALSDSSSLKKQSSPTSYQLTTDSLDALRGHSLEGTSSSKSVNLPPMLGYILVALIIIGFTLLFYFVVIKRIKNGISDFGYQIKHAKDKIEDTIEQKTPEDMSAEEKERIKTLMSQLDKFGKT